MTRITLDGRTIDAAPGASILEASISAGLYIPSLCWHPDLTAAPAPGAMTTVWQGAGERCYPAGAQFHGCDLCVVEIEGRPDLCHSCWVKAEPGMVVQTDTPRLREHRRAAFARILGPHPHACLSCRQRHGCSREPCSLNVPPGERCCSKLGQCTIEALYDHLEFASPLPSFVRDEKRAFRTPLFDFDWNLCVGCLRCVRVCDGVRKVGALGFTGAEGVLSVGFRARSPEESGCRFCGSCAEVCPTGAILDRSRTGADRERRLTACRSACPVGFDVPAFVRAVGQDRPEVAARIIRDSAPFGETLGHICHAPCRENCRRAQIDDAVSVCAIKRFACEESAPDRSRPALSTGKRIAVVGAGPAGLTAAWWLARKGHRVGVYEAKPEPGGMLRWGIPAFRLPVSVVRREIAKIEPLGVEIWTSTPVEDVTLLRLRYDAVLVATGLPRSRRLGIPGEGSDRVLYGLEFLDAARSSERPLPAPGAVLVIGGGNVALDAALTASRLGASSVTLACLEREGEMPAFEWELKRAREEGVQIRNGWGPVGFVEEGGGVNAEFQRCVSVFDEARRFSPRFDPSDRLTVHADTVIVAIGQQRDPSFRPGTDPARGIFITGDAAGGRCSVADAVGSAKEAAATIDRYLGGDGQSMEDMLLPVREGLGTLGRLDGFATWREVPLHTGGERGLASVEPGYLAEEARREASRCLQCDLRLDLRAAPMPPRREPLSLLTEENVAALPEREGVLQLFAEDRHLLQIVGTADLRAEAGKHLTGGRVCYFVFEIDPYYTKRESELLQAYTQRHGKMPEGVESLDDLY